MAEQQQAGTENAQQGGQATEQQENKGAENPAAENGGQDAAALAAKVEAQLKVNRDQEAKLNQLRDGLKSALGIEDNKDGDTDKLVSALQEQLNALTHQNLVSDVARRHQITDDADLAILSTIKDKDSLEQIAKRLAPQGGNAGGSNPGKPGTPRPDPSQGSTGGGKAGTTVSAGRDLWAEKHPAK